MDWVYNSTVIAGKNLFSALVIIFYYYLPRHCQCGKESREIRCSQTESFLCGNVCGKLLNCGVHTCEKLCHVDSCEDCSIVLEKGILKIGMMLFFFFSHHKRI